MGRMKKKKKREKDLGQVRDFSRKMCVFVQINIFDKCLLNFQTTRHSVSFPPFVISLYIFFLFKTFFVWHDTSWKVNSKWIMFSVCFILLLFLLVLFLIRPYRNIKPLFSQYGQCGKNVGVCVCLRLEWHFMSMPNSILKSPLLV